MSRHLERDDDNGFEQIRVFTSALSKCEEVAWRHLRLYEGGYGGIV